MTQPSLVSTPTPRSVFSIQSKNVKELEKAWKQGTRLINESLRTNDRDAIAIQTKLMALLFSSYTEAIFSKLIHTPYALQQIEIDNLKAVFKRNSYKGWIECLKLVSNTIPNKPHAYILNVISDITNLINNYIKEPSEVRNRMVHGQWVIALNTNNTQENADISAKIKALDIVTLTRYKKSFTLMSLIIEDLVESPHKAHINTYQTKITNFNIEQIKMATWTLADRVASLKPKPKLCAECISSIKKNQ